MPYIPEGYIIAFVSIIFGMLFGNIARKTTPIEKTDLTIKKLLVMIAGVFPVLIAAYFAVMLNSYHRFIQDLLFSAPIGIVAYLISFLTFTIIVGNLKK